MDQQTCGSCQHWAPDEGEDFEAEGIAQDPEETPDRRAIAEASLANPRRRCMAVPFFTTPEALASTAIVRDGSGYHGALYTRAVFGCVLHAPKTA